MNRMIIQMGMVFLLIFVGRPDSVKAAGSSIAKAMKDLRWGMSEDEVKLYLKHQIKKDYTTRIKQANGKRKQKLIGEARSKIKGIERNHVEFNGRSPKWDRSLIAYEFTHNNSETMLVAEDKNSTNYYFFIDGALWKWVKAIDTRSSPVKNFRQFQKVLEKRFGRGYSKTVVRFPGAPESDLIEWRDRNTRLHAINSSAKHRKFCLIFEEISTVQQLSSLRINPDKRYAHKSSSKKVAPSSSKYESVATKQKPQATQKKTRKSVFAHEAKTETEEEYQARKKRILDKRAKAEQAAHERKMAAKRAKALDALKGLEDNDPLSGL